MRDSKISGAELPKAISVKLATVSFQIGTGMKRPPDSSFSFFLLAIALMADMKIAAMMSTPRKHQSRVMKYMNARMLMFHACSPGKKGNSSPPPPSSQILASNFMAAEQTYHAWRLKGSFDLE